MWIIAILMLLASGVCYSSAAINARKARKEHRKLTKSDYVLQKRAYRYMQAAHILLLAGAAIIILLKV